MTTNEIVAVAGLFLTLVGIFVRYGIVLPMQNAIQPLEGSIVTLTESLQEAQQERKDLGATIQRHDIRITIQEQDAKNINRKLDRIEEKIDNKQQRPHSVH